MESDSAISQTALLKNIIAKDIGQSEAESVIISTDVQKSNFENIKGVGDGSTMEFVYRESSSGYNIFDNITGFNLADTTIFRHTDFASTNKIGRISDGLGDVSTYTTGGARAISTTDILKHVHLRDPNGGSRTDTTDSATNIGTDVLFYDGATTEIIYVNTGAAGETITIAGGAGVTIYNNEGAADAVIPAVTGARLLFVRVSSTVVRVFVTVFEAV